MYDIEMEVEGVNNRKVRWTVLGHVASVVYPFHSVAKSVHNLCKV